VFVYAPKVEREKARQSALRMLLSRFFDNSAEQLVHNLLRNEKLSRAEMKRLQQMIEEAK
jgi:predicted transcriptional regulator